MIASFVLAAVAATAAGVQRDVLIPGKFFTPQRQVVLIGDTVTWQNKDATTHTATASDGSFDSGDLLPGRTFSETFVAPGIHPYFCRIHRFMRAEVDVYGLALDAPRYAVPIGQQISLKGLAPSSVGQITIRRQNDGGGYTDVGIAPVGGDGSFRFSLIADSSAVYIAAAGPLTSGPAPVTVAPRLTLRVEAEGQRARLTVSTQPSQPRAFVELQRYVFERFDFVSLRKKRLDARGRATFRVSTSRKLHVRALLPAGVQGYGRAVSRTVLIVPHSRS